jgi:adenosylcobinamide-GDP ribazoletransferase
MAALLHALPNARGGGLAARVGAPPRAAVLLGGGLALAVAGSAAGGPGLIAAGVAAGAVWAVGRLARAKLGGQTGDVLGAAQVVAETAALLTFCALP